MTQPGVPDNDMPTFPRQALPEAQNLDALLDGSCRPEETSAALRPVAEVLAALKAPPDQREVARWAQTLTVYRDTAGRPGRHGRPRLRRSGSIAAPLGNRLAAAAAAAALAVLGGGAAAAYTGSLPAGLQTIAHRAIAAPGVRTSPALQAAEGAARPNGPSVTGKAAGGLCNAYQHATEHGNATQRAVAFRNLVNAAGGADHVAAYCAAVRASAAASSPGRKAAPSTTPAGTDHGRKPTTPPGNGNNTGNGNGNGNNNGNNNGTGNGNSSGNGNSNGNGGGNGNGNGNGNGKGTAK